jgi:CRP-like cAMP-binding protein
MEIIVDQLKKFLVFNGISERELKEISKIVEPVAFGNQETIFVEDSPGRDFFLLLEGRVEISMAIPDSERKEEQIFVVRAPGIFGEFAFIDGSHRSATARSKGQSKLLEVPYKKFSDYLRKNPLVGYKVMQNMARILTERIRNANLAWRNALIWGA